jgi:hypothetical protein
VVLIVIAIRSVTGTTFEASGRSLLTLLVFALVLNDSRPWTTPGVRSTSVPSRRMSPTADANR